MKKNIRFLLRYIRNNDQSKRIHHKSIILILQFPEGSNAKS